MTRPLLYWAGMGYAGLLIGLGFHEYLYGGFWLGLSAVGFAVLLAVVTDVGYRKGRI